MKVILSTPGWPASAAPAAAPPTTTLSTPAGRPASRASSAKRSIPKGDSSGGLATTALPAARAGPHFWPIPIIEPFHGRDHGHHAVRLEADEGQARLARQDLAVELVAPAGVVADPGGRVAARGS